MPFCRGARNTARGRSRHFFQLTFAHASSHADRGDIVLRRHHTPLDIEAKLTTMKHGSVKHGVYTPLQVGHQRPNHLCSRSTTPIPGLFLGGASMYPGGMILGGPGFLAAGVVGQFLRSAGGNRPEK
jgi:phytoene dehydrogenase-like protein